MPKLAAKPVGAGAGPLLYLPYTVYCSTVPRKQKAFALGVLDSFSQLFGCCVLALFGHFRIAIPLKARGEGLRCSLEP